MPPIHTIDLRYLDRPQRVGCFLILAPSGPILIETGPASTYDHLVAGLAEHGLQPKDIKHAFVTHIHLDHAGAAGLLAQHGATIYVHEFGAKHLIDPSKLIASATRIYGDAMDRLWGKMIPVPAHRVHLLHDGDSLDFGNLRFTAIETPGHARHHHAIRMEAVGEPTISPVCFTGDVTSEILPGVPSTRFLSLPTPPPEFDREAWLASMTRLKQHNFAALYLTHFGKVDHVQAHIDAVSDAVIRHSDFVIAHAQQGKDEPQIREPYKQWLWKQARDANVPPDLAEHYINGMLSMNITGILRYWRKRSQ